MKSEGSESHVLAEVLSRVRRRVLKAELEGSTVNERPKTGSGKKFSISIQVPDDMAAQWPDRSTAERLIEEIFRAMSGASPAPPPARRIRTPVVVLFRVPGSESLCRILLAGGPSGDYGHPRHRAVIGTSGRDAPGRTDRSTARRGPVFIHDLCRRGPTCAGRPVAGGPGSYGCGARGRVSCADWSLPAARECGHPGSAAGAGRVQAERSRVGETVHCVPRHVYRSEGRRPPRECASDPPLRGRGHCRAGTGCPALVTRVRSLLPPRLVSPG